MDIINLLGSAAGTLTTIAFVPQVLKTWRTRSGEDISTGMFLLFSSGVLLWLLYGVALDAAPIIIANTITLLLALTIILLKWRYRNRAVAEE
ncbi:MAG TPA: SemiSWEET transporter [Gammaproteobacteria bacterium]